MLLRAFPSMFESSSREFPQNCVYKYAGLSCFIENLHRKVSVANFLSYDIESAKKVHLLDLHIKTISCSITMFLILAKNN